MVGAHSGPPPAGWFNIFTVAPITEGPRMSEDRQQERKDLERPGMPVGGGGAVQAGEAISWNLEQNWKRWKMGEKKD